MYAHIKRFHAEAKKVIGSSWLYNREAYTRLFPREYGQSARASRLGLVGRGLWGQLRTFEQQGRCFPYQMLIVEAPIELFYAFYGI